MVFTVHIKKCSKTLLVYWVCVHVNVFICHLRPTWYLHTHTHSKNKTSNMLINAWYGSLEGMKTFFCFGFCGIFVLPNSPSFLKREYTQIPLSDVAEIFNGIIEVDFFTLTHLKFRTCDWIWSIRTSIFFHLNCLCGGLPSSNISLVYTHVSAHRINFHNEILFQFHQVA